MKIIQVGHYPQNETVIRGGTQAAIYGLVTELVRMKHTVDVVSLPDRSRKKDGVVTRKNLQINYFANRHRFNMLGIFRLPAIAKHIKAGKADVVHFHGADVLIFLLYIYCRLKDVKAIVTIHGLAYIEKRNAWRRKRSVKNGLQMIMQSGIEFMLVNTLRQAIVDTAYVEDAFKRVKKKLLLFRLPTFHIIPQGINEQYFHLPDAAEHEKLLSVGSLNERKGHLHLIKTMEKVIPEFPTVKLNILGNIRERAYYQQLTDYIYKKSLDKNIQIITGISFSELTAYYTTANIFVLHSEEESQGIVFCEAMASGKPVVATNSGGIPDVVMDGKGGLLSAFSDHDMFANNIKTLLRNEQLRAQFSNFNRQYARKYSWTTIAEQIIAVYRSL